MYQMVLQCQHATKKGQFTGWFVAQVEIPNLLATLFGDPVLPMPLRCVTGNKAQLVVWSAWQWVRPLQIRVLGSEASWWATSLCSTRQHRVRWSHVTVGRWVGGLAVGMKVSRKSWAHWGRLNVTFSDILRYWDIFSWCWESCQLKVI